MNTRVTGVVFCVRSVNNSCILGSQDIFWGEVGKRLGFDATRARGPGPALWLVLVLGVGKC